jgi:hypothetical protein
MDRFLNRPNIERFRKLRQTQNAAERRQILKQLAEEMAKFKLELRNIDLSREPSSIECCPG